MAGSVIGSWQGFLLPLPLPSKVDGRDETECVAEEGGFDDDNFEQSVLAKDYDGPLSDITRILSIVFKADCM
jgi:hypothetical protein